METVTKSKGGLIFSMVVEVLQYNSYQEAIAAPTWVYLCVLISCTWVQSTLAARLGMCVVYNILYMGKFSQNIYEQNSSCLLGKCNCVNETMRVH